MKMSISLYEWLDYLIGNSDHIFGHKYRSKPHKRLIRRSHHSHQEEKEKARRRLQLERGIIQSI